MMRIWTFALLATLAACASTPAAPAGSREEAVNREWQRICNSGYCEGFVGSVTERTDSSLTVLINGNTRFMVYSVTGGPGAYVVRMRPSANGGRTRPA